VVVTHDQSFADFIGPTAPFTVPHDGVYEFDFASVELATLVVEALNSSGSGYVASRLLNTHDRDGTITAVLAPGTYRLNNTGPGAASVTVSGPT
jgi:hypothetical protein